MARELRTSVLIVGGGTGGTAAALALSRQGVACIVTEPTNWIGGQLTNQAVPPDENAWIEDRPRVQSATRSYFAFRDAVRMWYRQHRSLTATARANERLNPGNGWVSHLCFEPRVGHAVLCDMLTPHTASGLLTVLLEHEPIAADADGDVVRSVTFRDNRNSNRVTIHADYILDATEQGDLYPLAGIEHAIGAEHRDVYGELHGRDDRTEPTDQQAISWCFALEHRPGENHVIDRPAKYAFWRSYVPALEPAWPGPLFSWTIWGVEDRPQTLSMRPWPDEPVEGQWEMWRYRRIVDRSLYEGTNGTLPDVSLINWVQMDYFLKPTLGVRDADRDTAFAEAKEQSRCLLYWLQTEAPRHDGGVGYPGLKLRGDELGTADGFAMSPYIREARRLLARTVVHEGHVGEEQRHNEGRPRLDHEPFAVAEPFTDSVGIGHYRMDLHPSCAGRNSLYLRAAPFRIPLGALIPQRVRNVLAAGKGLGVTHVTNGCYRLHPVEWNVGEAAGLLAAWCLQRGIEPHSVHISAALVRDFQHLLKAEGIALSWPWEIA